MFDDQLQTCVFSLCSITWQEEAKKGWERRSNSTHSVRVFFQFSRLSIRFDFFFFFFRTARRVWSCVWIWLINHFYLFYLMLFYFFFLINYASKDEEQNPPIFIWSLCPTDQYIKNRSHFRARTTSTFVEPSRASIHSSSYLTLQHHYTETCSDWLSRNTNPTSSTRFAYSLPEVSY